MFCTPVQAMPVLPKTPSPLYAEPGIQRHQKRFCTSKRFCLNDLTHTRKILDFLHMGLDLAKTALPKAVKPRHPIMRIRVPPSLAARLLEIARDTLPV